LASSNASCGDAPPSSLLIEIAQTVDALGALQAVALDPFSVGAIVDALYEIGMGGQERVVGITQGWKLSGAIKTAERNGRGWLPLMRRGNAPPRYPSVLRPFPGPAPFSGRLDKLR
jgi:hypothetical protein